MIRVDAIRCESIREETGLKSFRDKNEGAYRFGRGEGNSLVGDPPNLSYDWEGRRRNEKCEDKRKDEQNKKIKKV